MLDYYESYNFLKKPIKSKIKQLTNGKLLNEQPFYNQPIKKNKKKKNQQINSYYAYFLFAKSKPLIKKVEVIH